MKPDVVLFGEQLPEAFTKATAAVRTAARLLVLGSSLMVHPVAGLVPTAKETMTRVAIVNREPTAYDRIADLVVHAELVPTSEALRARL